MTRVSRRAVAVCCVAFAIPLLAPAAPAVTLNWAAASSGFIGVAGNWNPVQVPVAGDILRFDVGPGPYTLTCTSAVPTVASHDYRQGTVFINCSQPHALTTQLTVGSGAGQVVTARLQSGTLTAGWSTLVGTGAGADGTLQVIGAAAHLLQDTSVVNPVFTVGGASATGTFRVGSGGVAELARGLDIGLHAGSLGTVRVNGESAGAGAHASQLLANRVTADVTLGGDSGHGVLEVTDGGLAHVARHLVLAAGSADVADLTVSGPGALGDSRLEVGGDLRVGANTSGAAAGQANVTLADGAFVGVGGLTTIGDANGSTATFTMLAGSQLVTHDLALPQSTALANVTGGLVQIDGGAFSASLSGLRIPGGADGPDFEMRNGATGTFASVSPVASLVVGDGSFATLALLGASSLTTSGGRGVIGLQAGSNGSLQVRESSTFDAASRLDVGDAGSGSLHVWSGAVANVPGIDVARQAGSSGNVTVRDNNSVLNVTDLLNVGGTSTLPGGSAQVEVSLQGTLSLLRAGKSGKVWPGGLITLGDFTQLDLAGTLDVAGTLTTANGSTDGGTVSLLPGGVLSGKGDVNSAVTTGTDTTTRITATGPLSLGVNGLAGGFTNRGLLEVGPHSVTLRGASGILPGNTTMAGGELHLGAAATLESGKRLTGTGTVFGSLTCLGNIVATGPAGLSIANSLSGAGTGVGGTLLHLLANGGFSGGGRLDLPVLADANSFVQLGSDLTMGVPAVANALQLNGRITSIGHRLELRSGTDVVLGGPVTMTLGTIALAGGAARVRVAPNGSLFVTGSVTPPLAVDGLLDVGVSLTPVTVGGALECSAGSRTTIEVGSAGIGFFGHVVASGPLSVAGTFDFAPTSTYDRGGADSLLVMSGSTRTGAFTTLLYGGEPAAGEYELHYSPTGVWLMFPRTVGVERGPGGADVPATLAFAANGTPGSHVALELALPAAANVTVEVYDVGGRRVATLHEGALAAGRHRFAAARSGADAGVYYARAIVESDRAIETRNVRFVTLR